VLELSSKDDNAKHNAAGVTNDATLMEVIAHAVKKGQLTAYNTYDHNFTAKMMSKQLKEIIEGHTDTQMVVDPTTNEEKLVIVHHDFNQASVHKYRLLEEWTYDPKTGKTEIRIKGIAPIRDVLGDDGVLRGVQAMFWLRYADARQVLSQYDQLHPTEPFASLIADDYFYSDVKPTGQK